ncbi:type II toxin-antitoxin system Phd/YefM family antitoxin [Rhodococcus opacus]|uniref:type II toxin-antitoxin system Phd/YefM family antitoxin n=1 Tax=Rhodococcus opacus TaxID=37919 RepID=UPI001C44FBFF|nr:type II toxin-antitoxin system Phd/YefM family antitoxin [Rhodococcus opacus]MBV6758602.1 type II toxin-antitoxin system Phd/YefM family antitoxin [Rhodococcus opacus]
MTTAQRPAEVSVTHARDHLSATIAELSSVQAIQLVNRGRVVAVLVSPERFETLLDAAEDAEDYRAIAEHNSDPDPDPIPWEDVKRDLGLLG